MKEKLQHLLNGQIAVAVIFLVFGLCLIFMPAGTLTVLCKVVFGLALIASGVYHIVMEVTEKPGRVHHLTDLYTGVITLVIGIFLFRNPQLVIKILPWMLGACILIDCIWMFRDASFLRKRQVNLWEGLAIVMAVFAVLAVFLIFRSFNQVRGMLTFAGWVFLLKGASDLLFYFLVSKRKKSLDRPPHGPQGYQPVSVTPGRPMLQSPQNVQDNVVYEMPPQNSSAQGQDPFQDVPPMAQPDFSEPLGNGPEEL